MKSLTGSDLAKAIEQLTAQQTTQAQEAYSLLIAKLVGAFTIKYEIPVQSGAVSAISRILKKLDDEGIRQIRAMSDLLLRVDENLLREELLELQAQLLPMSAQTHQVKTRSAFINTILRPFDYKYAKRWLEERKDINSSELRGQIENLERRSLETSDDIVRWTSDVLDLFNSVVIFWGEEADQYYLRPAGTISPKSSRTYVQAWTTFIEKFLGQALDLALSDKNSASDEVNYAMSAPRNTEQGLGQSIPDDFNSFSSTKLLSQDSLYKVDGLSSKRPRESRVPTSKAKPAWIKVLLESRLDATAQASRNWDSPSTFHESLSTWIKSIDIIWGAAAREMSAKVSVKTPDGEAELTIPNVNVKDAEQRIVQTVELLQGSAS